LVKAGGFRHLDPSATKVYAGTILYRMQFEDMCFHVKVRGGYIVETPFFKPWTRGQSLETLLSMGITAEPIQYLSDG